MSSTLLSSSLNVPMSLVSSIISIPVLNAVSVKMRLSSLPRQGTNFNPDQWNHYDLVKASDGWFQINLNSLNLSNGSYEYEFVVERFNNGTKERIIVQDPYAEEITKFAGTRGVLRIKDKHRIRLPFDWQGELPNGTKLAPNNEIVIYELPMRWVDSPGESYDRQVGLGTFDKAIFERLPYLKDLGINCIELLPVQDSSDTLNWGYGTRFFFAPDYDMGQVYDLKLFIKKCHQLGIRVIMDIVMNHSKKCPLEDLAFDWFYLKDGKEEESQGEPRPAWGGSIFKYRNPVDGIYYARNFHFDMAKFWIENYHIDGFRIDEFKGINNWDFIREFRKKAEHNHNTLFSDRPFIVIAEDSWCRAKATKGGQERSVDAIWSFDYRENIRNLVANKIHTNLGQPGRDQRVKSLIWGDKVWVNYSSNWRDEGFSDMAQRITYCTSHDVEGHHEQRLLQYYFSELQGNTDVINSFEEITRASQNIQYSFEQVVSTFALMLTTPGIPMFLAGEEFAELHDTHHYDWRQKMSDPVDWQRVKKARHNNVFERVKSLIQLRTSEPALHRNETEFIYIHPTFNENNGERVFAYVRTNGQTVGKQGQVLVIANLSHLQYDEFVMKWAWNTSNIQEFSKDKNNYKPFEFRNNCNYSNINIPLNPFQVRVFKV